MENLFDSISLLFRCKNEKSFNTRLHTSMQPRNCARFSTLFYTVYMYIDRSIFLVIILLLRFHQQPVSASLWNIVRQLNNINNRYYKYNVLLSLLSVNSLKLDRIAIACIDCDTVTMIKRKQVLYNDHCNPTTNII